jgi:galactonate dehydratase
MSFVWTASPAEIQRMVDQLSAAREAVGPTIDICADILYYVPFAPHMVASFLGAMASSHVCASVPNFMILEWQTYFDTNPMCKEIVTYEGPQVEKGFITVSDKPGIGVELNEEAMRKYATPGVPFFE